MQTAPTLTERRKADREAMAAQLQALALQHGATARRCEFEGPREIALEIEAPGGLRVRVDLDGDSVQPDVHVLPWVCWAEGVRLAPGFGTVNPHHGRKATHVARGWPGLRAEIERGLRAAADGTAYVSA